MSEEPQEPRRADHWQEDLEQRGLLQPGERVLALLEQDLPSGARRGVALTDSRLFSFANGRITRQVVFGESESAECRVRLRRTARYEFRMEDGTTASVLLNGEPDDLNDFCAPLDEVCSARFPGFTPKEPPPEEPAPPEPDPRQARPAERAPRRPRSVPLQIPAAAAGLRESSISPDAPDLASLAALLLAFGGLLPGYGLVFAVAALGVLVSGRSARRRGASEWTGPLHTFTLSLVALGLLSFFLYRYALRFPASLEHGLLAYHRTLPGLLAGSWVGRAAAAVVVLLFSVSFHEAAHALVSYWNGDPTGAKMGRITLNPLAHLDPFGSILLPVMLAWSSAGSFFFAYARPVPVNPNRYRNLRAGYITVSFAGPGTNFLLALVGIWLQFFLACLVVVVHGLAGISLALHPVVETVFFFLWLLVFLNIFLGCFNLLPIPPLDGYHLLQGALPWRWTEFLRPVERYGFFILLILLMSGALGGFFDVVGAFSDYGAAFRGLLVPPGPSGA